MGCIPFSKMKSVVVVIFNGLIIIYHARRHGHHHAHVPDWPNELEELVEALAYCNTCACTTFPNLSTNTM